MSLQPTDVVIVGGGIVGLATALAVHEAHPHQAIVVIEKEADVAAHQTGHNSGVIHAGIYYKPGSYKARLCVEGARMLTEFCVANGIPYERCGKVVVATSAEQLPRLHDLHARGIANGVGGMEIIGPERLRELEPHARGVAALHSPMTAIVDFREVAKAMARRLEAEGVRVITRCRLEAVERRPGEIEVETTQGHLPSRWLINCAGLQSDRVARMSRVRPGLRIIPFRGEYYVVRPERRLVRALIYPVPDPAFPFLGVHFTRRIGGEIEAGPNAVLAFAREGYRKRDVSIGELGGMTSYRGFWAMARRYWRVGLFEMYRSVSRRAFVHALQELLPDLAESDVRPGGSGVRAQAVAPDGTLIDDFKIVPSERALHVLNAPSPAATASLAIGKHIASMAASSFALADR